MDALLRQKIERKRAMIVYDIQHNGLQIGQLLQMTMEEKAPLLIKTAEVLACDELLKGTDIVEWQKRCIEAEHFRGAQGIKNIIEWLAKELDLP